MHPAAKSVFTFGLYLVAVGLGIVIAPNAVLGPLGFPPADEAWLRVLAVVVLVLSCYYLLAARAGLTLFFRWTVLARCAVFAAFLALALLGLAPRSIALLGAVDLVGAIWTMMALRAAAASIDP